MIKFKILSHLDRKIDADDLALQTDGGILIRKWSKYDYDFTWNEARECNQLYVEFDPESAAEFLRSKGYKVKPPVKPAPVPNGCFRVECQGVDQPFFVEGQEEEKEKISLDFQRRGYIVDKIEFAKDQFYFV